MAVNAPLYGLVIQSGPAPKPAWQKGSTYVDSDTAVMRPYQQKDGYTTTNSFWGRRGVVESKPTSYNHHSVVPDKIEVLLGKIIELLGSKGKRVAGQSVGNGGNMLPPNVAGGNMLGRQPADPYGMRRMSTDSYHTASSDLSTVSSDFSPSLYRELDDLIKDEAVKKETSAVIKKEQIDGAYQTDPVFEPKQEKQSFATQTENTGDSTIRQLFKLNSDLQKELDTARKYGHDISRHMMMMATYMGVPNTAQLHAAMDRAVESGDYTEIDEMRSEIRNAFNNLVNERANQLQRDRHARDISNDIRVAAAMNTKARPNVRHVASGGEGDVSRMPPAKAQRIINQSNQTGFNLANTDGVKKVKARKGKVAGNGLKINTTVPKVKGPRITKKNVGKSMDERIPEVRAKRVSRK